MNCCIVYLKLLHSKYSAWSTIWLLRHDAILGLLCFLFLFLFNPFFKPNIYFIVIYDLMMWGFKFKCEKSCL